MTLISPATQSTSPSGPPSADRILELICLVQGDDLRNAFPLKIDSRESVGTLKQAIKKACIRLRSYRHPRLWNVSIPADGLLTRDPRILDLAEDQSLLLPTNRLSKIFSDPLGEEDIHVVVRASAVGE